MIIIITRSFSYCQSFLIDRFSVDCIKNYRYRYRCRTQSNYHVRAVYPIVAQYVSRGIFPIDCIRQILFLKQCFQSALIDDCAKIHTHSRNVKNFRHFFNKKRLTKRSISFSPSKISITVANRDGGE